MENPMPARLSLPLAKPADVIRLASTTYTGEIMAMPYRAKRWIPKTVVTPDYTNQLDLFSEVPVEDNPAPVAPEPARKTGTAHGRARPPEQLGFGALEPLPAEDAGAVAPRGSAGDGAARDGGADNRIPVGARGGEKKGT